MAKVFNLLMVGALISFTLYLFNGSGENLTSLVAFMLNPVGWQTGEFWGVFSGLTGMALAGGLTIAIGSAALLKQDWIVRLGYITALSTMIMGPYVALFNFFHSQLSYTAICSNAPICTNIDGLMGIGNLLGFIIVGPMLLFALWNCIEYVYKGDSF